MSDSSFSVRGRDEYHDRGVRQFECAAPDDAAREYLRTYVEDWRGGEFDQLRLSLEVWRGVEAQQNATRYSGIVSSERDQRGNFKFTYEVQQEI
jgi:hypothetical protein